MLNMKKFKFMRRTLLYMLLGSAVYHLGHPWDLHDAPKCDPVFQITADCGSKAFYNRDIDTWLRVVHFNLMQDAIGDTPVIANIKIKIPSICNTGFSLGDSKNLIVFGSIFTMGQNDSSCPIMQSK